MKKLPKNSKKKLKNSTFKPISYISIMFKNPGGTTAPSVPRFQRSCSGVKVWKKQKQNIYGSYGVLF